MHITTEDANDILVRVCLGFWRVFSGGRSKKPGHLRLSGHCSRPRVPCDRKPRPDETLYVTYCAGPHCNGAARAALRLARLGRPVKIMAGGIAGWLDEGFPLSE